MSLGFLVFERLLWMLEPLLKVTLTEQGKSKTLCSVNKRQDNLQASFSRRSGDFWVCQEQNRPPTANIPHYFRQQWVFKCVLPVLCLCSYLCLLSPSVQDSLLQLVSRASPCLYTTLRFSTFARTCHIGNNLGTSHAPVLWSQKTYRDTLWTPHCGPCVGQCWAKNLEGPNHSPITTHDIQPRRFIFLKSCPSVRPPLPPFIFY